MIGYGYNDLSVLSMETKVKPIDSGCSVVAVLYDGYGNEALYRRICGQKAEVKVKGERFSFVGKHSRILVIKEDYNVFSVAISEGSGKRPEFVVIGRSGEHKQYVSAVVLYNREQGKKFHLLTIVEQDSGQSCFRNKVLFRGEEFVYCRDVLEPLLAALPIRFNLNLFINQALGRTEYYIKEVTQRTGTSLDDEEEVEEGYSEDDILYDENAVIEFEDYAEDHDERAEFDDENTEEV